MKKSKYIIGLLCFSTILSSCCSQKDCISYSKTSILYYCDTEVQEIFSLEELPETLVLEQIGDDYTVEKITDPVIIKETMDAIREINVVGTTDDDLEDSSETYVFTMKNGDSCMISFSQTDLETMDANYSTVETEALYDVRDKIISDSHND